ncbi:MAG: YbaK/EbsC family protein [bacterium]|nr:YbaK/EbsC family protein [bacterium]
MGMEEVERIKAYFKQQNMQPTYLEHEPVLTSEDAAKTRGFELKQGIKAIVLTNGNNEWLIVDVPADRKVNIKAVAEKKSWSKGKTRMATPEEVLEKTGCQIGAVPPFGHRESLPIFVDTGVFENRDSAFNIGLRTHSVKIKTEQMRKIFQALHAVEGSFTY